MTSTRRTVFVTGANGFIGKTICRVFVHAGWAVYGVVRRKGLVGLLPAEEIIPVLGRPQKLADVIVLTTEQIPGYDAHFKAVMLLVQTLPDSSNK